MANQIKEKEIKTAWPVTTGLAAGTTKTEGRTINLVAQGLNNKKTLIKRESEKGIR